MTLDQLKAEHGGLVKQLLDAERDRVGAWLVYIDVDPETCIKGIKDGLVMTQTQTADFARKLASKEKLGQMEAAAPDPVKTKEENANKTKEEADKSAFFDAVRKNMGKK